MSKEGYSHEQCDLMNDQIKDLTLKRDALYEAIETLRNVSNIVEDGKGLHGED